jgi:hypothetical protein
MPMTPVCTITSRVLFLMVEHYNDYYDDDIYNKRRETNVGAQKKIFLYSFTVLGMISIDKAYKKA